MGHQFPRAVVAAALTLVAACGGGDDAAEPPPVLDNARRQVGVTARSTEEAADDAPAPTDELPTPDPSLFVGANRVVNLWFGADGATTPIAVWGRRTFAAGPIRLEASLGATESSGYSAAPPNYELSIVGAGAGADGIELAGVVNAAEGEQLTTVFTNADDTGTARSFSLWETGGRAPAPAAPGSGLVRVTAVNLDAVDDRLVRAVGVDTFAIGDGAGGCAVDRGRAGVSDAAVAALDPSARLELERPPGAWTLTLHPSTAEPDCSGRPLAAVDVDVTPDGATHVLVYSRDGSSIEMVTLAVDPTDRSTD